MSIKGKAAIVGYGCTKPVRKSEDTVWGLCAEAATKAIEDAGLRKEDIDGLLTFSTGVELSDWTQSLSHYMQLPLTMANTMGIMGANGAGEIWRAAAAIDAGLCNCVLCVGGNAMETAAGARVGRGMGGRPPATNPRTGYETPYGAAGAPSGYALIAQRHAYEFGTTDEQRALIAVYQRFNACANPTAIFYGQPITVKDVLNSRMISTPLHLLECVMPAIAAAAVIVTSAERAKVLPHPPVYLLGAGEHIAPPELYKPRMSEHPCSVSARRAFEMAGVRPSDINMCSLYDCFTITVMIELEGAGFCKIGESGPFVEATDLTYKGKLPVNTHGGQLSWGQPTGSAAGGLTHVIDATEQLMGRAGERQVPNCELAFVNGQGGAWTTASLILGRQPS